MAIDPPIINGIRGAPLLGHVYAASTKHPPDFVEVLIFFDKAFQWCIGIYDAKRKEYVSRLPSCDALYWTIVPSRSIRVLERLSNSVPNS